MSGFAGAFFVPSIARSLLDSGSRVPPCDGFDHHVQSYADADVALMVASRFPQPVPSGSLAEIVQAEGHVLAIEGYVLNLQDLVDSGMQQGRSTAGVLLQSFLRDGGRSLASLQGAYNLVVWNKVERSATVRTSRFGQRQLYLRPMEGGLTMASDLCALRSLSGRQFELDPETAWMSFLYGGVYGTATPLASVEKVLPGTTLTIRQGGMSRSLATRLGEPDQPGRADKTFHLERLDSALRGAVRRLGRVAGSHAVMMGSGVDSSLVAAYAKQEIQGVRAVTEQMPGALDESPQAGRIADALGVPHQVVPYRIAERRLLDDVASFVRIAEEPAYWNQLGPALLSLLQSMRHRPEGFLTGAEGDFLFNYRPRPVSIARVIRYGLFRPVAAHVARRLVNRVTRHTHIVGSDFDLLDRPLMRRHMAACPAAAQRAYYVHDYEHLASGPGAQRHFLNNGWQNVRIISQFGRAVGAEALFPYMDDAVVSAVLSLPDEMMINKVALRLLLRRFLPKSIVPTKKAGYWAHTIRWHYESGALQEVLDLIADRRTVERGVYDEAALAGLGRTYAAHAAEPRHHPVLWQLVLFEMFCREFVDAQ